MPINFYELIGDGDLDGARAKFERLIVGIAHVKHQAMGVSAKPGDWGIDAFFGELDGIIAVWQAKFFIDTVDDTQKKQIRESFNSAMKAAKDNGHGVATWTLCLPIDLDPAATKWWQTWRRGRERDDRVLIDLWDRTRLEGVLLTPECIHLARHFFPNSIGTAEPGGSPSVLPLPADHDYDTALFVKQLEASAIVETESAKRQFFNYEALSRDVADKGDPTEKDTLSTVEAEVHAIWETGFGAASHDPGTGIDTDLVARVMAEIKAHHGTAPPSLPPMSFIHHMGTMHRVVENGDAGWVAHFRQIAESYRA